MAESSQRINGKVFGQVVWNSVLPKETEGYKSSFFVRPYSQGNPSQVIFKDSTQFSRGSYHARCVDGVAEEEIASKGSWAFHVSKKRNHKICHF